MSSALRSRRRPTRPSSRPMPRPTKTLTMWRRTSSTRPTVPPSSSSVAITPIPSLRTPLCRPSHRPTSPTSWRCLPVRQFLFQCFLRLHSLTLFVPAPLSDIIHTGKLSNLQLEAIVYGCQRHGVDLPTAEPTGTAESTATASDGSSDSLKTLAPARAGFLLGDSAGMGKVRLHSLLSPRFSTSD